MEAAGPSPLTEVELDKKFFSDRSLRHGEENKDVSLGQEERNAWQLWEEKVKQFKKRRQQGPAPIFTTEMEVLGHVLAGVKQDESCIQVEYLQSREEVARIQAVKHKKQKAGAASVNQ